jgi:ABC-type nitrate/sulfonate/bicarbonate transport system substrate-binding protein
MIGSRVPIAVCGPATASVFPRARLVCALVAILVLATAVGAAAASRVTPTKGVSVYTDGTSNADSLKVAYPGNNVIAMATYVGLAKHTFAKAGLSLTLGDGFFGTTPGLVASGQYDIAMYPTPPVLSASDQGKPMSVILGFAGAGTDAGVFALKSHAANVDALKNLKGCKLGTAAVGTDAYGFALAYKNNVFPNCSVQAFPSSVAVVAALARGDVDAAVGNPFRYTPMIQAGTLVTVIDTTKVADRKKYLGVTYFDTVEFGLTSNLKAKRSAVVKYQKGRWAAWKLITKMTNLQVATILHKFAPFGSRDLTDLASDVGLQRTYLNRGSTNGYITKGQWNAALQGMATWQIPGYNASNPAYSYEQRVDMSYYIKAIGKPRGG